jgi:hypothetical protein
VVAVDLWPRRVGPWKPVTPPNLRARRQFAIILPSSLPPA